MRSTRWVSTCVVLSCCGFVDVVVVVVLLGEIGQRSITLVGD